MQITCLIAAASKPQNIYSYYTTRKYEKAKPVKVVESYNLHNYLAKIAENVEKNPRV